MRISDWSSDVCSSDLLAAGIAVRHLVFGDAVGIQAAELRPGLEDDDVMAVHGKAMRAGQPRRAAADHGDLPPGTGGAAERMRIDRRSMIGRVSMQKESERRRVGKECLRKCRIRSVQIHATKKTKRTDNTH